MSVSALSTFFLSNMKYVHSLLSMFSEGRMTIKCFQLILADLTEQAQPDTSQLLVSFYFLSRVGRGESRGEQPSSNQEMFLIERIYVNFSFLEDLSIE